MLLQYKAEGYLRRSKKTQFSNNGLERKTPRWIHFEGRIVINGNRQDKLLMI